MGIKNFLQTTPAIAETIRDSFLNEILTEESLHDRYGVETGKELDYANPIVNAIKSVEDTYTLAPEVAQHKSIYDNGTTVLESIINLNNTYTQGTNETFSKVDALKDTTYNYVFKVYDKSIDGVLINPSYASMKVGVLSMASSIAYKTIYKEDGVNFEIGSPDLSADTIELAPEDPWATGIGEALHALNELPVSYFHYKNEPEWTKSYLGIIAERYDHFANIADNTVITKRIFPTLPEDDIFYDVTYTEDQLKSMKQYASILTDNEGKAQNVLSTLGVLLKSAQETQDRLLQMEMSIFGEDAPTRPGLKPNLFENAEPGVETEAIFSQRPVSLGLNRIVKLLSNGLFDNPDPQFRDDTLQYDMIEQEVKSEVEILRDAVFGTVYDASNVFQRINLFADKTPEEITDISSRYPKVTNMADGSLPETEEISGANDAINRLFEKVSTLTEMLNVEDNANQYPSLLKYLLEALLFETDTDKVIDIWEKKTPIESFNNKLDLLERFITEYKALDPIFISTITNNNIPKVGTVKSLEVIEQDDVDSEGNPIKVLINKDKTINYDGINRDSFDDFTQYANIIDILVDTIGSDVLPRMENSDSNRNLERGNKNIHERLVSIENALDNLLSIHMNEYTSEEARKFETLQLGDLNVSELTNKIGSIEKFLFLLSNTLGIDIVSKEGEDTEYTIYERQRLVENTETRNSKEVFPGVRENLYMAILDLLHIAGFKDRQKAGNLGDTEEIINGTTRTSLRGSLDIVGRSYHTFTSTGLDNNGNPEPFLKEENGIANKSWNWKGDNFVEMINSLKNYTETLVGELSRLKDNQLFGADSVEYNTHSIVSTLISLKNYTNNLLGVSTQDALVKSFDVFEDNNASPKSIAEIPIKLKNYIDKLVGTDSPDATHPDDKPEGGDGSIDTVTNKLNIFAAAFTEHNGTDLTSAISGLKDYLVKVIGIGEDDSVQVALDGIFSTVTYDGTSIIDALNKLKTYLTTIVGIDADETTTTWKDIYATDKTITSTKEAIDVLKAYIDEKIGLVTDEFSDVNLEDERLLDGSTVATIDTFTRNADANSIIDELNDLKVYFETFIGKFDDEHVAVDDGKATSILSIEAGNVLNLIKSLKEYFEGFIGKFTDTDLTDNLNGSANDITNETVLDYVRSLKNYFETSLGDITTVNHLYRNSDGTLLDTEPTTFVEAINSLKTYFETVIGTTTTGATLDGLYDDIQGKLNGSETIITALNKLYDFIGDIDSTSGDKESNDTQGGAFNDGIASDNLIGAINELETRLDEEETRTAEFERRISDNETFKNNISTYTINSLVPVLTGKTFENEDVYRLVTTEQAPQRVILNEGGVDYTIGTVLESRALTNTGNIRKAVDTGVNLGYSAYNFAFTDEADTYILEYTRSTTPAWYGVEFSVDSNKFDNLSSLESHTDIDTGIGIIDVAFGNASTPNSITKNLSVTHTDGNEDNITFITNSNSVLIEINKSAFRQNTLQNISFDVTYNIQDTNGIYADNGTQSFDNVQLYVPIISETITNKSVNIENGGIEWTCDSVEPVPTSIDVPSKITNPVSLEFGTPVLGETVSIPCTLVVPKGTASGSLNSVFKHNYIKTNGNGSFSKDVTYDISYSENPWDDFPNGIEDSLIITPGNVLSEKSGDYYIHTLSIDISIDEEKLDVSNYGKITLEVDFKGSNEMTNLNPSESNESFVYVTADITLTRTGAGTTTKTYTGVNII